MRPAVLIPFLAAVHCFEIGLVFVGLSVFRVSRRPENRVFGALALGLSGMIWCILEMQEGPPLAQGLAWYRAQFACMFLSVAALLDLMARLAAHPLPRLIAPPRLYALAGLLALGTLHPWVLHLPPPGSLPANIDDDAPGPLFGPYPLMLAAATTFACSLGLRRTPASAGAGAPFLLARARRLISLGIALFILSGMYEFWELYFIPEAGSENDFPINPRALAALLFCSLTAWVMACEMRRRERERRRLEGESEARLRAVLDVRHEIGNNLAGIISPLRAALHYVARGAAVPAGRLADALSEAEALDRMVRTMLNVARMEAGQPPQLEPKRSLDVVALTEAVCRTQSDLAAREREAAAIRGAPPAPPCRLRVCSELPEPILRVSPDTLKQVLGNLVSNAVKYSPNGGDITVRLWREEDTLRLSLSDHGLGIAPGRLPGLFARPFERGPAADQGIPGTGLGLPLVGRLVEAMGGRVWAESAVAAGSTFFLTLPWEDDPGS